MHITTKAARLELWWRNQGEDAVNREMERRMTRYLEKKGITIVPSPRILRITKRSA